jgi:hypothetical protein
MMMTIHEILDEGWVKRAVFGSVFVFEKENSLLIWDSDTKEVLREFNF